MQTHVPVHWSSCLICQLVVDYYGIYLYSRESEHFFSFEAMYQLSLIRNRQGFFLKERKHEQELPTEGRGKSIDRGQTIPVQNWKPLLLNKYNTQSSYFLLDLYNELLGQFASLTRSVLSFLTKSCSFSFRSILVFSLLSQELSQESVQTTIRSTEMPMPSSKFFSSKLYYNKLIISH